MVRPVRLLHKPVRPVLNHKLLNEAQIATEWSVESNIKNGERGNYTNRCDQQNTEVRIYQNRKWSVRHSEKQISLTSETISQTGPTTI